MKKYILIPILLSVFLNFAPALAQSDPASPPVTIKQEEVKGLIETLKNDTAREDLIRNLQLLIEQQPSIAEEKLPEMIPALTEQLGFRGKISKLVKEYERFLEKNDLTSSTIHQTAGTVLAAMIGIGLFFLVRKITRRIIRSLDSISAKAGMRLTRIALYTKGLQFVFRFLISGITFYTIGKIWEIDSVTGIFEGAMMRGFLSTGITFLFVAVIAAAVWESVGIYLSYILKQADDNNQTRVKTLLPIFRNIVLSVFGLLFGLVLLSELGINVAPLIAGAGVVGVAIGFGAQSMVKDFLTGFTIILEDVIRVGDVVTLGGCNGVVEKITLRKVQLRDFAGIVYTIPFSQITTIQNMTKDFSFYVMDIGVSYNQDTDKVVSVLKEIDKDLQSDYAFSPLILAPLEIVGVDRFDDSAVIIKARIKTIPIKQWDVGREFNRRMKIAFDKAGIEIPFPQRVITIRNEKEEAAE